MKARATRQERLSFDSTTGDGRAARWAELRRCENVADYFLPLFLISRLPRGLLATELRKFLTECPIPVILIFRGQR